MRAIGTGFIIGLGEVAAMAPAKTGATVVICILNTADLKRIHSAMKTLRCNSHGFVLWVTSKEKIHEGAQ